MRYPNQNINSHADERRFRKVDGEIYKENKDNLKKDQKQFEYVKSDEDM